MERQVMSDGTPERRFRTLFISDVHLGARGSQADRLLDFLRVHDADTIYLVGDIVDGWALKSSWHWPQSHNDFVQKMLRKVRKGVRVIYVPGNHDEFLRSYYGTHFGGVEVVENAIHEGVDGKRYLVIHGDIFDLVVQNARWLAHLGDKAYDSAELRQWLKRRGTKAVVPNRSNRKLPFSFDKKSYKQRHRIENAFCRLKDFRRIATRYDKLARNFLAAVHLAALVAYWLN